MRTGRYELSLLQGSRTGRRFHHGVSALSTPHQDSPRKKNESSRRQPRSRCQQRNQCGKGPTDQCLPLGGHFRNRRRCLRHNPAIQSRDGIRPAPALLRCYRLRYDRLDTGSNFRLADCWFRTSVIISGTDWHRPSVRKIELHRSRRGDALHIPCSDSDDIARGNRGCMGKVED